MSPQQRHNNQRQDATAEETIQLWMRNPKEVVTVVVTVTPTEHFTSFFFVLWLVTSVVI